MPASSSRSGVHSIFCLTVDRDGSLWAGTEGGGLLHLRGNTVTVFSAPQGLSDGFVRSVFQDRDGGLWVGTDNGLFRMSSGSLRRIDGTSVPAMAVHAITQDRDGNIWAGGSQLISINPAGAARVYTLPGTYSKNRVKSILQTSDGTIWVGTVGGLQQLRDGQFQPMPAIHATVRSLLQTNDGTLWIGTIGNGLWTCRDGKLNALRIPGLLPSDTVLTMLQDDTGQIWTGTQTGLVRLSRTPVGIIALPRVGDSDFETVSGDAQGNVWVAAQGLFTIRNGQAIPTQFPGLGQLSIRNIFRGRDGALWIGTDGSGAYRVDGAAVRHLSAPGELTNNFIRGFLQTRDGAVWIATDEGRKPHRRKRHPQIQRGFRPGLLQHALPARRPRRQRLDRHRPRRELLERRRIPDQPRYNRAGKRKSLVHPSGSPQCPLVRQKRATMASSATATAASNNSPPRRAFPPTASTNCCRTATASSGSPARIPSPPSAKRKWTTARLRSSTRSACASTTCPSELKARRFTAAASLPATSAPDSTVWFPTSRGVAYVRAGSQSSGGSGPRAIIHRISEDDRDVPMQNSVHIPAGVTRLSIVFGAISLQSQQDLRFRYRLEPLESAWNSTRAEETATYTNLRAGDYRFRIQAFDASRPSQVSEVVIGFVKAQYFYQTWWFLTLCLLLAAAIVWGVYRLRLQQMQTRFRAVLAERGRLAREIHDTVIQGCTSISALLEAIASQDNPVANSELLDYARNQARTTIQEARQAVWDMRHEEKKVDLLEAMRSLAEQTTREHGTSRHRKCRRRIAARGNLSRA